MEHRTTQPEIDQRILVVDSPDEWVALRDGTCEDGKPLVTLLVPAQDGCQRCGRSWNIDGRPESVFIHDGHLVHGVCDDRWDDVEWVPAATATVAWIAPIIGPDDQGYTPPDPPHPRGYVRVLDDGLAALHHTTEGSGWTCTWVDLGPDPASQVGRYAIGIDNVEDTS